MVKTKKLLLIGAAGVLLHSSIDARKMNDHMMKKDMMNDHMMMHDDMKHEDMMKMHKMMMKRMMSVSEMLMSLHHSCMSECCNMKMMKMMNCGETESCCKEIMHLQNKVSKMMHNHMSTSEEKMLYHNISESLMNIAKRMEKMKMEMSHHKKMMGCVSKMMRMIDATAKKIKNKMK